MYKITKQTFNGYVCLCCFDYWEQDPEYTDSLEDALSIFQKDFFKEVYSGDHGILKIHVTDTETGKVVGRGKLSWPYYYKYDGYQHKRWAGVVNGKRFEQISTTFTDSPTWRVIRSRCKKQAQERKLHAQQSLK